MKTWQKWALGGAVAIMLLVLLHKPLQRLALNTMIKVVGNDVETVSPHEALAMKEAVLLDTRTDAEYAVSHIGGARKVGYDDFSVEQVKDIDIETPIIVYCSLGARSKDIGKKLQAAGYEEVYNLRGGIFRWIDEGFPVKDENGQLTIKVHPYNWFWGLFAVAGEKSYQP